MSDLADTPDPLASQRVWTTRSQLPWSSVGVFALGVGLLAGCGVWSASGLLAATAIVWPPFILVAGLLLIGFVAAEDGVFEELAGFIARLPISSNGMYAGLMVLVALVTSLFNLDTSVAFLTPILILAARRRGFNESLFLYSCVFMSNAASLLLPGSNLTNLLVTGSAESGLAFASSTFPAWTGSIVTTGVVSWLLLGRGANGKKPVDAHMGTGAVTIGAATAIVAGALVLLDRSPALPVLAVGALAAGSHVLRRKTSLWAIARRINLLTLAGLFGLAASARVSVPLLGDLGWMGSISPLQAAFVAIVTAVAINNLPAAALLAGTPVHHPIALLIGLNLGPNLAVTGSLSSVLWFQAAKSVSAQPSIRTYSRIGLFVVPASVIVALVVSALTGRHL